MSAGSDVTIVDSDSSDGHGHAATELDTASLVSVISSDDDDYMVPISEPLGMVDYWSARVPRFRNIWAEASSDLSIVFDLSPTRIADDIAAQYTHSKQVVQRCLDGGYIAQFSIGVTHLPVYRFRNPHWGYAKRRYKSLVLLSVHDDAERIANLEINLLKVFRKFNSRDELVNPQGHALCRNRAPGGENAYGGVAPFFCYMAIKPTV